MITNFLASLTLVGIPPAPRGVPQIEVTFDIDANGIVNVSAKDKATGKEQQIRIQASGGLSDEDIEQMVKDAEDNAESDKKRKEVIEARNQAETMIHQTEQSLEEVGEDIADEDRSATEAALKDLKDILDGEDVEAIKEKTTALMQAAMKIGEAAYRKAQETQASEASDVNPDDIMDDDNQEESGSEDKPEKADDADVVEADYTELEIDEEDDSDSEKKSA